MADIWMDVDTAITIPVNKVPIVASSDGFTTDETIAYNESGMDLNWNFVTTAGVQTQTNVVPTTAGDYDWTHVGNAIYKIEMTSSGGVSANNDTEGFGWFSGNADAICPFSGPIIGFRAAALNNALIDGGDTLNVSLTEIMGTALTEGAGGRLKAAFVKLFDVVTPTLVASDVMRGTDLAALASVVGALNNAAAAGEVTTADTLMQYLKQLINILIGDPGVVTFKAEAAPGNAISLSEVIRAIHADVTGLNGASGSAWVTATGFSTHNAAAVKSAIEAGGSHLTLIKAITDALPNSGALTDIATDAARLTAVRAAVLTDWINNGRLDVLLDAIKVVTDNMSAAATTMITGTVSWNNTNATTTVIYSDDITEATADHYNGRLFVPTSGALLGQYTEITDYALDTGEGKFTVTAMTEPPADNTTFVIL